MNSNKTQTEQVKAHLLCEGRIDPMTALKKLGVFRLGARIWELRQDGLPITKVMKKVRTRDGFTRVAEYRL